MFLCLCVYSHVQCILKLKKIVHLHSSYKVFTSLKKLLYSSFFCHNPYYADIKNKNYYNYQEPLYIPSVREKKKTKTEIEVKTIMKMTRNYAQLVFMSNRHTLRSDAIFGNWKPFKIMENVFISPSFKDLFVLKIFKFLSWYFGHTEKRLD